MRHRKSGRKLGRTSAHRKAMFRNMVTSLFEHGRITTTDPRAKELRRLAAKLITLGKKNTLHAKRVAAQTVRTRSVLTKLFDEIAPGFSERHGGYTRIVKVGSRHGDGAPLAIIELMPPGPPQRKREAVAPTKPTAVTPETKEKFD
jgi:large subunit ribosomal protein L17